MADLTVSANVDSLLACANNAAMLTTLGITTLGTTTPAAGVATFLATPTGANLATALTTALPATKGGTGLVALGTGIATALGVNIGSAGAPVVFNGDAGTPSALVLTNATFPKTDISQAADFAADAGASDTYVATLSPAITAYVTGVSYRFKANTANTGAATINFNSLGAKTIVKLQGAITTTLADNDIRAGQWIECVYDGTNMQMQTQLGNAPSASITGTDKQVMFFDGANNPAGNIGLTFDKTTNTLSLGTGSAVAGCEEFGQGTAPTVGTNSVKIFADTAVTAYMIKLMAAIGSTGLMQWNVSGTTATLSSVTQLPSNITVDGTTSVGFLSVPSNSQSAAYPIVLADAGKSIDHPSSDANARTYTIPANASVAFPVGTCISFSNMTSQAVTIAITTDTMNLAGTGTTGSRTLAQYGVATARKVASTVWLINGTGLT